MDLEGRAQPPMANGEVIFEAPWQSRTFGMARTLCEQGLFEWDDLREYLIDEIDVWERDNPGGIGYEYFDRFLAALTRLLDEKRVCEAAELASRSETFAARPHGHDH